MLELRRSWHVALGLVCAAAVLRGLHLSATSALVLTLGLTLSIGMLHGACDVWALRGQTRWLAAYVAVVALLMALLWQHTVQSMALLVIFSVWHFGELWQPGHHGAWLMRWVRGASPVALPWWTSPQALQELMAKGVASHALPQLDTLWATWQVLAWGWLTALALWGWLWWRADAAHAPEHAAIFVELVLIAMLNLLLGPLLAFGVFFAGYHAALHLWRMVSIHAPRTRAWVAAGAATSASVVMVLVLEATQQTRGLNLAEHAASLPPLWAVLAALTLPHMCCVHVLAQRGHFASARGSFKSEAQPMPTP